MEENNRREKGIIENLKPKVAFKAGLFTGLGIMFVIGFFVLLGMMLNDADFSLSKGSDNNNNGPVNTDPIVGATLAEQMSSLAKNLKIDTKKFDACFAEGTHASKVQADAKQAQDAGGRGTPYSIILVGDKKIPIPGALPYESIKTTLDALIAGEVSADDNPAINISGYNKDIDWLRGDKDAKITIVEFSDIDCPFCKRFHTTMKQIITDYDGQVNWVYRHFPLTNLHPDATKKAEAAECAGDVGGSDKFWQFVDALSVI
ncbi:MAG: thioredoxin domain-containing protein [Candidatus Komeilibacteria bacterium]|jgi:protein-disulfide isomerase|nr:thioredoxin domain-containing protein [Candidatus Komeilibacteria bacterium]